MRRFKAWLFVWLCGDMIKEQVKIEADLRANDLSLQQQIRELQQARKPIAVATETHAQPKVLKMRNFADFQRVMTPSEDQ